MSISRLRLFSYPKCGTCRKALQWLDQQGFSVGKGTLELIDITLEPPALEDLQLAFNSLGRKRLFNTSGQSYRASGRGSRRPQR